MLRILALGVALWVSVVGPERAAARCTPRDPCCMVCDKGQAAASTPGSFASAKRTGSDGSRTEMGQSERSSAA